MWGDRFGINTYAYTQTMSAAECVRRLAERGVTAFELMFFPGHLWIDDSDAVLRDLRRAIEASGGTLVSLNSPNTDLNLAAATAEVRAHTVKLNSEYFRVAGELGAAGLIVGPGKANPLFSLPRATMEEHFFRALDALLPIANSTGVELWAENMSFAFLPDADGLMEALARYGAHDIGFCYDVANAHFIGENPAAGLERVAPRLRLIHLSDTTRAVYRHDAVGLGDVDFARLAPTIKAASPGRAPFLEIISGNPDRDIARSIEALAALGY
jgi:sugar phosphate isomerase/epimerase